MIRSLKLRAVIILAVIVWALVYIAPTMFNTTPGWWPDFLPNKKINLGLDLKGGMHLILEVETDEAVKSTLDRYSDNIAQVFKENKIRFKDIKRKGLTLIVHLNEASKTEAEKILPDEFPNVEIKEAANEKLVLGFTEKYIKYLTDFAVGQAVTTIRNRIDQFGVTEPDIRAMGNERILVELPGIKDPDRALKIIGKTARLEFKLVNEDFDLKNFNPDKIPEDSQLLYKTNRDEFGKVISKQPILVYKKVLLTGEYIKDARVNINPTYNEPYVSIEFDRQGSKLFDKITAANVGKRLAIILDNSVYSAPVIQERISGGRAQITGRFSEKEAHDLAIVLRAGALPAPVKVLEKRTIGPSLGHDSIKKGFYSMFIGGIVVLIFMIFYYSAAGIVANIALVLNLLFILATLAAFEATLTLPGIAGIILTIGMAVDGNVLIFERIREELRKGIKIRGAIENGFSRAFITIFDANVTTLIAAIVLYQYGTGPIKGFAVTLSIGIVSSMFTAIFVSRWIFELVLEKYRIKKLRIG
jgi:preprotein translocase subunit SecD